MISTVAFGYLLTFTNLQNVFAKTRIIFASKVKPLDLFSEHAKIESPLYAFKRLWKKVSGLSTYDGAKSSGTEIFEGRYASVAVNQLMYRSKALHEQCRRLVDIVVDVTIGEEQKWKINLFLVLWIVVYSKFHGKDFSPLLLVRVYLQFIHMNSHGKRHFITVACLAPFRSKIDIKVHE
ncbi:hypothetical protein T4D_13499 [Trichinella pseudospiralis]|uniref:Uncharacterized protein n=1 Tax=Trichinella pseudospiralis TaxID=6337 RepID=A0A0V1FGU8_TRIPS|nr:hypothetical protein T4D_13499 [Trichinella pseudospiralis]